ncbi:MAG TPA: phage holin family protein [Acidimicrobiia bacterium]|nr:phage holin family protein [Acidimicrobiia bacterium]
MKHLLSLLITGVALWIAVSLVNGLDFEGSAWTYAGVTLLLWVVNAVVKPIMNLLSLPIVVVTLGLFLLVTNALALGFVVWLSAPEQLDLGLTSTGFFWATFLGALTISLVRLILDRVLKV